MASGTIGRAKAISLPSFSTNSLSGSPMHQQVPAGSPPTPAALKLAAMSVPPEKLLRVSHRIRHSLKFLASADEASVWRCASKSRSQSTRYCMVPRSGTTSVLLPPGQIESTLRVGDGTAVLEVRVGEADELDGDDVDAVELLESEEPAVAGRDSALVF